MKNFIHSFSGLIIVVLLLSLTSQLHSQSCGIAHFTFNNTLQNAFGGGLNAVSGGAVFGNDRCQRPDSAMLFNEMDSIVVVADDPSIDFSSEMTASAWIHFGSATNSNPRILSKWGGPFTASSYELFTTQMTHGYRKVVFAVSDGFSLMEVESAQALEPFVWYHVAGVFENGVLKLYINGTLDNSESFSPFSINNSNSDLTIGQKNGSSGVDYFFGMLDDVMLFNCALSNVQLDSIFTEQQAACSVFDTTIVTVNDTIEVIENITVDDTLLINVSFIGMPGPPDENTVKVYPNPASDHLIIHNGDYNAMTGYQVMIKNAMGQQMFQAEMNQPLFFIDLNFWSGSGAYFLTITDPNGSVIDQRVILLQ